MTAVWTALLSCVGVLATGMVAGTLKDEVVGRLDRLPGGVLRLARRRLPEDVRADLAEEWEAELHAILAQAEGLPITRTVVGARYALGLLRAGPQIAGELTGVFPSRPSRVWLYMGSAVAMAAVVIGTTSSGPPAAVFVPDTRTASEALRAVLSFDHRRLDQDRAAAHARTTSRYSAEYDRMIREANWHAQLRDQRGAVSTDIIDSAVISSSGHQFTALVFVKRTITTEDAKPLKLTDSLRVTMVREGSSWLLDTAHLLNAATTPTPVSASEDWPAHEEQAVLNAVKQSAPARSGTPVQMAVRPHSSKDRASALIAVGGCRGSTCESASKIDMYRIELQRPPSGAWRVIRTERI